MILLIVHVKFIPVRGASYNVQIKIQNDDHTGKKLPQISNSQLKPSSLIIHAVHDWFCWNLFKLILGCSMVFSKNIL